MRGWPEEVQSFIRENVKGRSQDELAKMINEKFGMSVTANQIRWYKKNHKLTSGTKYKTPSYEERGIFPKGLEAYVRSIAPGMRRNDIATAVNEHFGEELFTERRMAAYMKNRGITNGLDCRFQKGQESPTKGKKQTDFMSPEAIERTKATRFKAGGKPVNELPVGSVVKNTEGYLLRKKQMEGSQWERWELLHRAIWEEHNGAIPEGMMVSFKDKNKENCDIENLMLITNAENLELHRMGLRFDDPDFTEAGLQVVKLKIRAGERKNEQRGLQRSDGGASSRERHESGEEEEKT